MADELVSVLHSLTNTVANFTAGKTAANVRNWEKLTSDPWIIETAKAYKIEFDRRPIQYSAPRPLKLGHKEQAALNASLAEFVDLSVIQRCSDTSNHQCKFMANLFVVGKRDNSHRVIFNIKELNQFVTYHHFKMETIKDALLLVTRGCFMASIDFKHAYFSVPVQYADRQYLCFRWQDQNFHFTCLPQGLSAAPRVFTKLMKPVLAHLRAKGITIVSYIDDSLLFANSREELTEAVYEAITLFDSLGLTVHPVKSEITPVHSIEFLGFIINAEDMTLTLTVTKKEKILHMARALLQSSRFPVRDLASLIGNLVAASPAVRGAPVHIKSLEIERNVALGLVHGDFDSFMGLTDVIKQELLWVIDTVPGSNMSIVPFDPQATLTTDASLKGWGAVCGTERTGGHWSWLESDHHINWLELYACFLGLQTFCDDYVHTDILVQMDNTTAVACINKMGSTKPALLSLIRDIDRWLNDRHIRLVATYIPGRVNIEADMESRNINLDAEWMLCTEVFQNVCKIFGMPSVDLFASRLNAQLPLYVAYRPDPSAIHIDAFTYSWKDKFVYCFPPFSVIGRVLQKLRTEEASCILIAPLWTTRPWWPRAMDLLVQEPRLLPKNCLFLPQAPSQRHSLKTLRLVAMLLSGRQSLNEDCRRVSQISSSNPGERAQLASIVSTSQDGVHFVVRGRVILCSPL